jgi:GTP-binding protein YchF
MGFNCGIVGLPNVGKSTLFNALTATAAAEVHNYPFTTIEPNVGRVAVPDPRVEKLARLAGSARAVPTHLEFVDIAGLVKGASRGEGLGNKFLGKIREVDAVVHVLRCFEDPNVAHVEPTIDPVRDAETVATELMLADLESLERRIEAAKKKIRGGDKEATARLDLMERAAAALGAGGPARSIRPSEAEAQHFRELQLLTAKPVLYVCNVEEEAAASGNRYSEAAAALAEAEGAGCVVISAEIEAEVAQLDDEAERKEFLSSLGLEETGLAKVIRAGYRLLDLVTFLTANPNEAHAWTVKRGATAWQAAGRVHTDFQRGFVAAEVTAFDDLVACGGEHGARDAGKLHVHGRDYVVEDGDVIKFRFST